MVTDRPTQERVLYSELMVNSTEITTVETARLNIYIYTYVTVRNPTGMRSSQTHSLHSETRVPRLSTKISSVFTKTGFRGPKLPGTHSRNPISLQTYL